MTRIDTISGVGLLLALTLATGIVLAQDEPAPPAPIEQELRTEWVIAPEGGQPPAAVQLPEGTVLQEGMLLPPGTVLPGGAILPAEPAAQVQAPPAPAQIPTPAPTPAPRADVVSGVPYLSGGIGVSGREEMLEVKSKFNLRLLFAVAGSGSYLADVRVRIDDAVGPTLLEAVSQGPWFYASLVPGRYILHVDNAGQVQTREITVPATGAIEQSFYWND
ncbi:carboxypeptidase regulatory-like domain-containing protein [Allochromatium palmeri]|uniref:Carboxypeptidase regulatory-like domain-containing protein n=1 Tax=Allochromatium palmeri TaxID=231048 RepID=A0A6N8EA76_9GAMM|nr:carboxypeptidase regulatory-like domain-containing protein [Allochromatium palmeri]MTW20218.1 carboxypeptidase regulatory-like domain-containing protein [Allochromatium palmeri]